MLNPENPTTGDEEYEVDEREYTEQEEGAEGSDVPVKEAPGQLYDVVDDTEEALEKFKNNLEPDE